MVGENQDEDNYEECGENCMHKYLHQSGKLEDCVKCFTDCMKLIGNETQGVLDILDKQTRKACTKMWEMCEKCGTEPKNGAQENLVYVFKLLVFN